MTFRLGSQTIERAVQVRVNPGADLLEALRSAVQSAGIEAAIIVSGLGALEKAVFRNLKRFPSQYPVQPEDRLYLEVTKPMELVSIGGWVAKRDDGQIEIHAHFSASMVEDEKVVTLGGHLTTGTITGIKVVIALLELTPGNVRAGFDATTQTFELALD